MMSENTHSTLIMHAARAALRPLGMFQKGRSRTWLGDHTWWLDVVEFQPSSSNKGSYLNVSCMWLWNVQSHLSFDVGHVREADFVEFQSNEQFGPVAEALAKRAAEKVLDFRALFPTARAVSDYFIKDSPGNTFWPLFNAAIAHGLSSRSEIGNGLLERAVNLLDEGTDWQRNAKLAARQLQSIIGSTGQFRREVAGRVEKTRGLLKLPPVEIDFNSDSSAPLSVE